MDALRQRHPPAAADRSPVPDPSTFDSMSVTERDVTAEIRSFPAGSAAGPDGLRPQHLLDLITGKEAGQKLVSAITALTNLLTVRGQVPSRSSYSPVWGKTVCPPEEVRRSKTNCHRLHMAPSSSKVCQQICHIAAR